MSASSQSWIKRGASDGFAVHHGQPRRASMSTLDVRDLSGFPKSRSAML
jgi:hypothetical protein